MTPLAYLRIWLASARYSAVRAMMFRFDFFLWLAVDTLWMIVNLLFLDVVFGHTAGMAGWTKQQMLLLYATSMLVMRLFFATAFTNLIAVDRNIREGTFDFYLAQPGNPLFMIATRKIEFDSLTNAVLAAALVLYAVHLNDLVIGVGDVLLYVYLIGCGLLIHFSIMTTLVSLGFWMGRSQGLEGGYFGLFEISRLPQDAIRQLKNGVMRGIMETAFVWVLPAIVVSNVPAATLLHGPRRELVAWLTGATVFWFLLATTIFHRGLRRYQSASS